MTTPEITQTMKVVLSHLIFIFALQICNGDDLKIFDAIPYGLTIGSTEKHTVEDNGNYIEKTNSVKIGSHLEVFFSENNLLTSVYLSGGKLSKMPRKWKKAGFDWGMSLKDFLKKTGNEVQKYEIEVSESKLKNASRKVTFVIGAKLYELVFYPKYEKTIEHINFLWVDGRSSKEPPPNQVNKEKIYSYRLRSVKITHDY